MFFAAAKRFLGEDSKIGVHSISNDRDIEDTGSKLLTMKHARFWAEHGIPNSAIGKMVTTRPGSIAYLDRTDLSGLQASAENPFAYETESITCGRPGAQTKLRNSTESREREGQTIK